MSVEKNRKNQPKWQDIMPKKRVVKTLQPTPKVLRKRHEIVLVLPALPNLKIPKKIRDLFFRNRRRKILGILAALCLVIGISLYLISRPSVTSVISDTTNPASPTLVRGTPEYITVLPSGKTIDQLGGWTRISPPNSNPVFTYVDKIDSTAITVSQQPLPDSLKDNTDQQVDQLAQSQGASEKLTVGSIKVHIGTFGKDRERIIFTKNNLLILITSNNRLTTNQWAAYINSLN
ncbi:hypothetical protein BH10PAT4_BH10PAT4_0800 [soil metagenome]